MKLPKIEEQINKKSNRIKSMAAFLGLGSGAMAAVHGFQGLAGLGLIIPMAFDAYTMHNLLNGKGGHKTSLTLYEPIFKRGMKKWINKYVDEPKDILEKKYRILFLKLWLSSKRLDLDSISDQFFEHFEDISSELQQKGMTRFPVAMLFNKYTESRSKEYFGEEVNANFFINEDKNDPQKVAVAKKAYEEYSEIGMAGNEFLKNRSCDGLLMLQDYKFTSTDYSLIQAYVNKPKVEDYGMFNGISITDEIEKVLPKIIEVENNPLKLKILDNYCHKMLTEEELFDDAAIQSIQKIIKTKIDYIELSAEMGTQEPLPGIQPKKEKRMKV